MSERIKAPEATQLVNKLQELLEMRLVALVAYDGWGDFSFLMPGDLDDADSAVLLAAVAVAAQNASKSL